MQEYQYLERFQRMVLQQYLYLLILQQPDVHLIVCLIVSRWFQTAIIQKYNTIDSYVRVVVFYCGRYNNIMNSFSLFGQLEFNFRH